MQTEQQIRLPDGRCLAYAEYGRAGGVPVMYFHGSPASRLEPLLVGDEAWQRLGLRVVAPDRPGIGGSDFQHRRGFVDWPADVLCLADALGWDRFSVLGNSGGGLYVAVCAARIAPRLQAAVIVSGGWRMDWPEARAGLPLPNRVALMLARGAPWLLRLLFKLMGGVAEGSNREQELAQLKARLPAPDATAFDAAGRLEAFAGVMREALRQGTRGAAHDLGLYVRELGFDLDEVQMPLTLFHGAQDTNAPIAMARRATRELPAATLVSYDDEAHLSTLVHHIDDIAAALTAGASITPESTRARRPPPAASR